MPHEADLGAPVVTMHPCRPYHTCAQLARSRVQAPCGKLPKKVTRTHWYSSSLQSRHVKTKDPDALWEQEFAVIKKGRRQLW